MAKASNKKSGADKRRIFLVENHPVFRDGLANLLNSEPDLTVCGEAGDAYQGLKSIIKLKPDLCVVDLGLPGKSGLELIKEVRAKKIPTKLLVVSMFDESLYAQRVLRAGGDGYVMKQEDPDEIVNAIHDVLAGRIYVSEEVLARGQKDAQKDSHAPAPKPVAVAKSDSEPKTVSLDELTDSELEVLEQLGLGKSPDEMSEQLDLTNAEVEKQTKSIQRKLKFKTANALMRYAVCWVEDSRQ